MTHTFSIREAFKAGWHIVRTHSGLVFAVVLTLFAIEVALQIVEHTLINTGIGVAASMVLSATSAVLGMGATVIALRLAEHKHTTFADIVPSWGVFWRMLVSGILIMLIVLGVVVVGGLAAVGVFFSVGAAASFDFTQGVFVGEVPWGALVVAGIPLLIATGLVVYLATRYSMGQYAIIEGAGVIEGLRKSWELTRPAMGKLLLFLLAAMVLNLVGLIPFGLGLLITMPLTMLAFAHIYVKLKTHHGH